VSLNVLPYARCKQMAVRGRVAGCFSASRTPETERDLLFPAHPVFEARNVLWVPVDSPLQGCDPRLAAPPSVAFVNATSTRPPWMPCATPARWSRT
jgi:polar amino acid transport system substrate-binding protein